MLLVVILVACAAIFWSLGAAATGERPLRVGSNRVDQPTTERLLAAESTSLVAEPDISISVPPRVPEPNSNGNPTQRLAELEAQIRRQEETIGLLNFIVKEQKETILFNNTNYMRSDVPPASQSSEGATADSNSSRTHRTAVCIAGAIRTFLDPEVQESFVARLHQPGYDYFVVSDVPYPAARASDIRIAPLRAWVYGGITGEVDSGRPGGLRVGEIPECAKNSCNAHRYLYYAIADRLVECYREIQREEGRRGWRYDTVLKIRPDHYFTHPLPPVGPTLAHAHPPGTVHIYDDQIALSRREDAAAILLTPVIVYTTCAGYRDWEIACGNIDQDMFRRCLVYKEEPCEPMRLLAAFGRVKTVLSLPWIPRAWEPGKEAPKTDGDWCLKRERSTQDNPQSQCRNEPGCMEC